MFVITFPPVDKSFFSVFGSFTRVLSILTSPCCLQGLRFTKTHCCFSHVRTHRWVWALANHGVSKGQASWGDLTRPASSLAKTKPGFGTGRTGRTNSNPIQVCLHHGIYGIRHPPCSYSYSYLREVSFRTCGTKRLLTEHACATVEIRAPQLCFPWEPSLSNWGVLPLCPGGGIRVLPRLGECHAWLSEPLLHFACNNLLDLFNPQTLFSIMSGIVYRAAGPSGNRTLHPGRVGAMVYPWSYAKATCWCGPLSASIYTCLL